MPQSRGNLLCGLLPVSPLLTRTRTNLVIENVETQIDPDVGEWDENWDATGKLITPN